MSIAKRKKLFDDFEIALRLDGYDDIFSDFDPRPYSKRAISDDFLSALKKGSWDKPINKIKVDLFIPKEKRDASHENIIKERLRHHFKRHLIMLLKKKNNIIKFGTSFVFVGLVLMLAATILLFYGEKTFFTSFLVVFLEPAGWFLFWEGLDQIVFEQRTIKPDLEFYEKMYKSKIYFPA